MGTVEGTSKPLPDVEVPTKFCMTPEVSKRPKELNWLPATL